MKSTLFSVVPAALVAITANGLAIKRDDSL